MKAEKTRHLFNNLTMLFAGFDTELKNGSVAHAHLNSAEKEITELEAKASQLDSPHIQELIECDRIERKLLDSCVEVECRMFGNGEVTVVLWLRSDVDFEFNGKSKLEALRKAEGWLDERGSK